MGRDCHPGASTTAQENYAWLGEFSRLREWIGDRQINRMKAHDYSIKNKKFEATEGIPADYIEDDTYGVLMPKFADMGYAAATHPDEMVFALLANGFAQKCYDGQFFFDTDHPVGPEGQEQSVANLQEGAGKPWFLLDTRRPLKPLIFQRRRDYRLLAKTDAGTSDHVFMADEYLYGVDARVNVGFGFWQQAFASKAALDEANFDGAVAGMMAHKSDKGRPLGINPSVLVVGPSNRAAAKALIETQTKANGASNPNYQAVKVMVVPWLD
ncbi:Mu-like prophage major head subunit gpT family protein [Zobellella denitrificans]|uniref:Mu-like prophage major head subunit gpT family protein n=1 Tax=Zobellella denitrificans TaxID=347534 RepID=UPI0018E06715|nr:Mu-like prophage major head subunit gpT family protein [Zobellella denitrificans]